jgi:hypothetical protein
MIAKLAFCLFSIEWCFVLRDKGDFHPSPVVYLPRNLKVALRL